MPNPAQFSAAEVYDLAIQTEHSGHAFYQAAAAAATDPDVQQIMRNLANAEQEHEKIFRRLRAGASAQRPESYPGEQGEYMDALLQSRVLPDTDTALGAVAAMADDREALDFALAFEKDTILFMLEMRDLLPEEEQERIDMLVEQERTHVRLLQAMKQSKG